MGEGRWVGGEMKMQTIKGPVKYGGGAWTSFSGQWDAMDGF